MSNNKKLLSHIALLESTVDHLETELVKLNFLLIQTGFSEGIKTLKETISEAFEENLLPRKSFKKY